MSDFKMREGDSVLPSISEYSKPLKVERKKLCTVYYLKPRSKAVKSGRELVVAYNNSMPLVPGLESNYTYFVRFFEKGNVAGNHFHYKKHELFIPIVGEMDVYLEDIKTKEKEFLTINVKQPVAINVPTGIAHAVKSTKEGDVLLVIASTSASDNDEVEYKLV